MVITYNGDGQVSRVEDKAAGHTTEYEYDGAGRLIRAYRADADGAPLLQAENLYDAYGRAKSSTYVMPNQRKITRLRIGISPRCFLRFPCPTQPELRRSAIPMMRLIGYLICS